MAYRHYQQFLNALEAAGELRRISVPVSPILQITEVADRVMKSGGPALLFENPTGFKMPVAINAFGSRRRMSMALGVDDFEQIGDEIATLTKPEFPEGIGAAIQMLPLVARLKDLPAKKVSRGICQEVVLRGDDIDLEALPHLLCWPDDGGRYITLPLVFTHDPVTGKRNVGMYRVQILDKKSCAMHWQMHKTGAEHARVARQAHNKVQVAIALGGDPALTYAATAPLPPGIDETLFAGFIRRKPVELCPAVSVDIRVPADAEIIIEGEIDPNDLVTEGPFGDHTGYYSLADLYPRVHVTAITMRHQAVYPCTIVGAPPMEDAWLGKATERIFLPLLKLVLPEVVDMNLPVEACFHNVVLISIKKRYPGHARKVMHAIWGTGQMMFSKIVIVFDDDVDVQNVKEAMWRFSNNIDPERDMELVKGPVDVLDHASRLPGFGSKIGFDATRKGADEGFNRPWPEVNRMSDDVKAVIDDLWPSLGL